MTWLLTGGAGYIGAHIVRALRESGRDVVVLDDLSSGVVTRLPADVPLVQASCTDAGAVEQALREHTVEGIIHLAGKKAVPESIERPLYYFRENIDGMVGVLEAAAAAGVHRLVFSSTCAVYGTPTGDGIVTEESPTAPESPYGESKLVSEWAMRDVARVSDLQYASLRYFNVAGAGAPELGDVGEFNLIPKVFRAITNWQNPVVFGGDYPTRDGSCIRDYIHVVDLAEAHVAAVAHLEAGACREIYNIGTGGGLSVIEVMRAAQAVTGVEFTFDIVDRRAGDPAQIVADPAKARDELDWRARLDIDDMVASAWEAWTG